MEDRRSFFRSLVPSNQSKEGKVEPKILRPPYSKDLSLFLSECPTCETYACATNCEEEIIVIGEDKTPILNLKDRGCTFCEVCAEACQKGVLDIKEGIEQINARFYIDTKACMAHFGTICFSCKEPCIDDAILFNGMFNPIIDEERCTGCGFCMSRCPSQAIGYEIIG